MEITGPNSKKPQNTSDKMVSNVAKKSTNATAGKATSTSAGNTANRSDTVSLTDTASRLKELEMGLANQPIVDTQRVQSVQGAINDGTYEVDPDSVAEKMIEFETDLDKTS